MIRVARKLAWEVLAKGRGTLSALAAALAIACVFATWRGAPPGGRADGSGDFAVFAMVVSMLFVFGTFNHTHLDRRSGQSGFPNRLFTYPVSTRLLVGVPMACALVTTVAIYLGWALLVIRPLGRVLPVVWPLLVLANAMAWYQAALWALAAFRVARLIALCVLGTTLLTIALLPTVDPEGGAWAASGQAAGIMAGSVALAYVVALVAVKRQRHAGGHGAGLRGLVERLLDAIPSRKRPFRSPLHAQLWLESARGALILPAGTLLVMLFVLLSAALLGRVDARLTQLTLFIIALTPIALAAVAGAVASLPVATSPDAPLSPFLAARPIDCGDMVAAKLGAAAIAVTLAWAIVLILTTAWLLAWCDPAPLTALWAWLGETFPGGRRWIMLVLCGATLWLLTWRMAVVNLYVATTGRPVTLTMYVMVAGGVAISVVTTVIVHLDAAVRAGPRGTIFGSLVALACFLNLMLVAKLALAGSSAATALRRGWVSGRAVAAYAGAWAGATLVVALTLYLLASREPTVARTMPWLGLIAALCGLLLVPLARIAWATQVLANLRHR